MSMRHCFIATPLSLMLFLALRQGVEAPSTLAPDCSSKLRPWSFADEMQEVDALRPLTVKSVRQVAYQIHGRMVYITEMK